MKVSIPQGTRDFAAETVRKRQYIFETLRRIFETYGFQPLETPAFENLETLMGKYGEEGDKLIFKILNNGLDRPEKKEAARVGFQKILDGKNSTEITERALRYDLTIPFARFIAMNHKQLTFPFKRYQMQPVWRADKPQRGRYREFYQCDADVAGSKSLWSDVECIQLYAHAFDALNIPVTIKLNNRKILTALAQATGRPENMESITVAIDKLDKIGLENVKAELRSKGLSEEQTELIEAYLNISGSTDDKLKAIRHLLSGVDSATEAIDEMYTILDRINLDAFKDVRLELDFTLARGLNYYTGSIFEVKAHGVQIGSIGGGGRYNDLTGLFGVNDIPGIGISFGLDRIYDVMENLSLFPDSTANQTDILFFNSGEAEAKQAGFLMQKLRQRGIKSDMFLEASRFDKQFKHAERAGYQYVAILGTRELEDRIIQVKNLKSGLQENFPQTEFADKWVP